MVSGAVIIGRPIGPGMIRPFTVEDFRDLKYKCNLALITDGEVEVAYPEYENSEGVLVNIWGGGGVESVQDFREDLERRLIFAAKRVEGLYRTSKGKPWESDLCSDKVCIVGYENKESSNIVWKPIYKIIETYSEENQREEYTRIAKGLLERTRETRLSRYEKKQESKIDRDLARIRDRVKNIPK